MTETTAETPAEKAAHADFPKHPNHDQYPETFGIEPHVYHRRWGVLAVLNVSLVLVVVAVSSVNVLLPTLGRARIDGGLGASGTQLQWIVDSYALVFAGLLLVAGALGDRFGRKYALEVGLVIFALCAFAASQADSPTQLMIARAFSGIGAALIMPSTLSIIVNCFPLHERSKAIAIWAGFAAIGGVIGPVTSGIALQHFWWGSAFFINIPIALGLLLAVALLVPNSKDPNHHELDFVGALLSIVAIVSLVFGVIEGPDRGWLDPLTLTAFAAFAIAFAGFVKWELHIHAPMLDPRLFKIPGFRMGSITVTLTFFSMFGMFFVLTQYFQYVKGYSPLAAAVHQLPSAAALIAIAPQSPKIVGKLGVKKTIRFGLVSLVVGFAIMTSVSGETSYWFVAVALMFFGAGIALCTPPASQLIVGSLPLSKAGVGSAVNDVTRELGGALGIAMLGSVAATAYKAKIENSPAVVNLASSNPKLAELTRNSYSSAQQAIEALKSRAGDQQIFGALTTETRDAFMHSIPWVFGSATAIAVCCAILIPRFIPDQLPTRRGLPVPEGAL